MNQYGEIYIDTCVRNPRGIRLQIACNTLLPTLAHSDSREWIGNGLCDIVHWLLPLYTAGFLTPVAESIIGLPQH
ncbi:hypothetical protein C8R26_10467 [Nitrosomonas oligotropha]|uniref:Uncharacterized protein n=1 Tax=Nitrosomonas oligotropha TaxID=42354 RepID=A0A2T5I2Q1_9PROT|nr:hypothetical protein C8R26_10467 [Nitrosomonas oligotropha]